jgi:hypothetical protein
MSLTIQSSEVTICTICIIVKNTHALKTQNIYEFLTILTMKRDYFLEQHYLCYKEAVCFL